MKRRHTISRAGRCLTRRDVALRGAQRRNKVKRRGDELGGRRITSGLGYGGHCVLVVVVRAFERGCDDGAGAAVLSLHCSGAAAPGTPQVARYNGNGAGANHLVGCLVGCGEVCGNAKEGECGHGPRSSCHYTAFTHSSTHS